MATFVEQPVSNSTATTGNATIILEDFKSWTGRLVFTATGGGTAALNYKVRLVGSSAETAANGFILKQASLSASGDVLLNNNDGDGCPINAYALYIEWDSLAHGVLNVLMRKSN
tara:strand:+ start:871 stop:1212 length:342 start_codon:yes stop_codon:yes gene_type:complete